MRKILSTIAMIVLLALVGCVPQGAQLDREVDVPGLSMDVPSTWVEERHEEYADDYGFGTRSYVIGEPESEDFGRIDIYYSEALQNETPEGYIESIYGSGMNYEMEDGPVIDGVQTRICRYTFEKPTTQWVDVFIYGPEMHYRISLYGELVEVERILDTIELG